MIKYTIVCTLAAALALVACSSKSETSSQSSASSPPLAQSTTAATPAAEASTGGQMMPSANQVTITLNPQNHSGESGTATLTALGDKTRVVIGITGENATGKQPAHIHMGTCANLNPAPKYPLKDVVLGKSNTVLDTPLRSLIKGNMAINVHESASNLKKYVACGDLKG